MFFDINHCNGGPKLAGREQKQRREYSTNVKIQFNYSTIIVIFHFDDDHDDDFSRVDYLSVVLSLKY